MEDRAFVASLQRGVDLGALRGWFLGGVAGRQAEILSAATI